MVAIYLTIGFLFLFTDVAIETFPAYREPIGITMLVYGIIRTVLIIQKIKRDDD
jgi:hypothetical protein